MNECLTNQTHKKMIKISEIEVNKDELIKSLDYNTTKEQLSESTHLPEDVCDLIVSAYKRPYEQLSCENYDLRRKYERLCEKVCEKLL